MQMAGSPYTPAAAAAASAGGFSSPRSTASPGVLAGQTPGQLAAALRAQNKSYDEVVLEYAEMVRVLPICPTPTVLPPQSVLVCVRVVGQSPLHIGHEGTSV